MAKRVNVTWLYAALDDLERIAKAATPGPWKAFGGDLVGIEQDGKTNAHTVAEMYYSLGCDMDGHPDRRFADACFVSTFDPTYVLRDIAAKRNILKVWERENERRGTCSEADQRAWLMSEVIVTIMGVFSGKTVSSGSSADLDSSRD